MVVVFPVSCTTRTALPTEIVLEPSQRPRAAGHAQSGPAAATNPVTLRVWVWEALADKIAAGKEVQLIVSADYAEKWGEKMKSAGVDLTANIHMYPDVHNKGFVVDGKTVIVSSQNFSPAGIDENRDAGMILESPELAQYFGPIFDADWKSSRPLVVNAGAAGAKKTTRSGAKKAKKTAAKKTAKKAKKGR